MWESVQHKLSHTSESFFPKLFFSIFSCKLQIFLIFSHFLGGFKSGTFRPSDGPARIDKQFFRLEQFCALHVWTCVDMSLESWAQCAETISDGVLLLLKQNYYNFLIHLFARAVWKSG